MFARGPEDRRIKTAAHGLGHGRFQLRHSFVPPLEIADTTDNLMSCHPTGTTLCKRQWDYLHDPQWRVFRFLQGEEEGRIEEIDDASAQYVITIYSPYLSVCIEEAFKLPTAKEREVRIYQLLSNAIKNGYLTEEQIKAIENDIENPKGYAKQIDIPYMSLCEVIVNNNQSNYVVFYLIPGTKIINAKGEWTETKIPYVLTRRVKSEVLQFGKGYSEGVSLCAGSTTINPAILAIKFRMKSLALIAPWNRLNYTVALSSPQSGNIGLGIGIGGAFSSGIGRDAHDNYALFTSVAGFVSYLCSFAGSDNPETGDNWYVGGAFSAGMSFCYSVYIIDRVDEALGGQCAEYHLDTPKGGVSYLGEFYDTKGLAVSFGIPSPATPSISMEAGAGKQISNTTQFWAFREKDVDYIDEVLCRMGAMMMQGGSCYIDYKQEANRIDFLVRWNDTNGDQLTETRIITFYKGTSKCPDCWVSESVAVVLKALDKKELENKE